LTPLGQVAFFIEFLNVSGRFEAWIGSCPLRYTSGNAPLVRDVLGTAMLSMLAGHKRYAHITALRSDSVLPELLGMTKIVSEDTVRRALKAIDERAGLEWLQRHIDLCTHPLLAEKYILDIDTTVKPLYGHQEGAVVSYNPKKPGRPSHVHHTYMLAGLRLIMGVETAAGNEHSALRARTVGAARPGWARLLADVVARRLRDCLAGRDAGGRAARHRLSVQATADKERETPDRAHMKGGWCDAGQGWQGKEETLRLNGWSRHRRVVVLRRRLKDGVVASARDHQNQLRLGFAEIEADTQLYEYAVLVTSSKEAALSIAQLYRDRADCENVFDELKNQWGWGGFTTKDLARCRLTARMVALIYNWWNLFVRLAEPDKHLEAITSRPLLLAGIAERVRHSRQTTLRIASTHGRAGWARSVLDGVAAFLRGLIDTAEQLTVDQKWSRILSHALRSWLKGRQLRAPPRLAAPA
jgi:hypothetical protein